MYLLCSDKYMWEQVFGALSFIVCSSDVGVTGYISNLENVQIYT